MNFTSIGFLDLFNLGLHLVNYACFENVYLSDWIDFSTVNALLILFTKLGDFLLDLFFFDIFKSQVKHGLLSVFVQKIFERKLILTSSRMTTVSHFFMTDNKVQLIY